MLLFCDSFDHYTTLAQKGWTISGGASIQAGTGRFLAAGRVRSSAVSGTGGTMQWNLAASETEVVLGAAIATTALGSGRFDFCEGATIHITVQINGSGNLEVRLGGPAGTLLATGTATLAINTYYYVEARVKIDDVTGSVDVRVNGAIDSSFSGDTRNGGASGVITNFKWIIPYLGALVAGVNCFIDDLVLMDVSGAVNNDFLGDVRVEALMPNGNGNSSQLLGSDGNSVDNYELVDEIPPDGDDTFVESSTVGEKDTYAFSDVSSTIGIVYGVQALLFARKTDASARSIAAIARSGATEEFSADKVLTTSYLYYAAIYEEDPDTSAPWSIASVDAAEFGVGITA